MQGDANAHAAATITLSAGGGATRLLRAASSYNHMPTMGAPITNKSTIAGRSRKRVGSGDLQKMAFSFSNFFMNNSAIGLPANSATVSAVVREVATGVRVPLTFGGASSLTMASGAVDQQADPVMPSAFGKTVFARATDYEVRWIAAVGANGTLCQVGANPVPGMEEAQFYDPDVTTSTAPERSPSRARPRPARRGYRS